MVWSRLEGACENKGESDAADEGGEFGRSYHCACVCGGEESGSEVNFVVVVVAFVWWRPSKTDPKEGVEEKSVIDEKKYGSDKVEGIGFGRTDYQSRAFKVECRMTVIGEVDNQIEDAFFCCNRQWKGRSRLPEPIEQNEEKRKENVEERVTEVRAARKQERILECILRGTYTFPPLCTAPARQLRRNNTLT